MGEHSTTFDAHSRPKPHPAYPRCVRKEGQHDPPYYSREYTESVRPTPTRPRNLLESVARGLAELTALAAYALACCHPLWGLLAGATEVGNKSLARSRTEAVWLRRFVLLESLAWLHGLGSGYLHHLHSILGNRGDAMASPLIREFEAHRHHQLIWLELAKPSLLVRLILLATQAATLPIFFGTCLVYMPFCFMFARYVAEVVVRLYTQALADLDAGKMPYLARAAAPPAAQRFYSLPANASARDALLCIRADDQFLARFNWLVGTYGHCKGLQHV